MLVQALKGKDPASLGGVVELAALELSFLLPLWVVGALVMGADPPSLDAMAVLAVGCILTSVARHAITRRRRRTTSD